MSYLSRPPWILAALALIVFPVAGCAVLPTQTVVPMAMPISTQTPIPTQTSKPTVTFTFTAMPTPTWAYTSTPTPTATAPPTETPAFGPSPTPDFSKVVLLPDDLPPGFEDYSIEECFATDEQMAGDENASLRGQKESFFTNDFCFFEEQHFELIFG